MKISMSTLTRGTLGFTGLFLTLGLGLPGTQGCVSVPDDIDAGGCIRTCSTQLTACSGEIESACPTGDVCLDVAELCWDDSAECAKHCTGCEDEGTCTDEDACADRCTDDANECLGMMRDCIDLKTACAETQLGEEKICLNGDGGFIDCTSDCIDEVEEQLRNIGP